MNNLTLVKKKVDKTSYLSITFFLFKNQILSTRNHYFLVRIREKVVVLLFILVMQSTKKIHMFLLILNNF